MMQSNPVRKIRRLLFPTLLVCVLVYVLYQWKFAPIPVEVIKVHTGPIFDKVLGTGTLDARLKSMIGPKISGRLMDVQVDQGDMVKKNDLLFVLEDEELRRQVEIAQAEIHMAHASIDLMVADRRRAEAVFHQAQRDYERLASLSSAQVATSVEFDKATEALKIAEAGLAKSEAAIIEARKRLITAESQLGFQKARLADTRILAPFDGLITRRHKDPGDVVVPGMTVLSLISTSELWISAWVDETRMGALKTGQPAEIIFRSESGTTYPGVVSRLGREVDRETREFLVDIKTLQLPSSWAIGQRAEVFIHAASWEATVVLPRNSLRWKDGSAGVFTASKGKCVWTPIKIGFEEPNQVEILEGLQPGMEVLLPKSPYSDIPVGRRILVP